MPVTLQDDVFNDQLPGSITFDPQVTTIGDVSDLQMAPLLPLIDQLRVLCDIPNQDEAVLDLLAFQFQVLFYDGTFSIVDDLARLTAKRNIIAQSFDFHCTLGTPAVLQKIITQIYVNAFVSEWFSYGGSAHHFRILTDNVINDTGVIAQILSTINIVKRASSWFDGFFTLITIPQQIYITVGVYCESFITLPVGLPGRVSTFITPGIVVRANARVLSSSQISRIQTGATVAVTANVVLAGAMVCTIRPGVTMSATAMALRRAIANIRAGRGPQAQQAKVNINIGLGVGA